MGTDEGLPVPGGPNGRQTQGGPATGDGGVRLLGEMRAGRLPSAGGTR
jgi:hypothetical protein